MIIIEKKQREFSISNETKSDDYLLDYLFNQNGGWQNKISYWSSTPDQIYEDKQFRNVLEECIQNLAHISKNVFIMKEIDGLKSKEICKELNLTPTNLWVIMHRTREKLRRCLEDRWFKK